MQTRSWIFVTACTLLFTGFVLSQAGWFSKESCPASRRSVPHVAATTQDLFASEAGARYHSGQPRHWKYLMLHH
jgi:hypothetical protein